jgi:polyphosphate kinase
MIDTPRESPPAGARPTELRRPPEEARPGKDALPAQAKPDVPKGEATKGDVSKGDVSKAEASKPAAAPPAPFTGPRFFNRDLSWLEFNRRVLAQAEDADIPLLERVRFLAIFASNLDEFFMKRVAFIRWQIRNAVETRSSDGRTPRQQLAAIRGVVQQLQDRQAKIWLEDLVPALASKNIRIVEFATLPTKDRLYLAEWYRNNIFPALTPLAVDRGHRFPFISNLSDNLAILAACGPDAGPDSELDDADLQFVRIKIPTGVRRYIPLPANGEGGDRLVHMVDVIRANLHTVLPGAFVKEQAHFRVTRASGMQADVGNAADDDLLRSVEAELKQRRFARVARLEIEPDPSPLLYRQLLDKLNIDPQDVYERRGPMEYSGLSEIADLNHPELKRRPWRGIVPARLAKKTTPGAGRPDLFAAIRKQDILLHHPYESFNDTVERFIAAAAADPDVLTIKQSLYRTSPDSPFIESLIRAAEAGKQVACLVEVRARFDEQRNLSFVQKLQKAGVHVAYGITGLKTHCKVSLVVRKERQGLRCYAHLGTGNYHPKTAQLYTDLGLLTCDPDLTGDVVDLFNVLTGLAPKQTYEHILVAPVNMRDRFNQMIDREIEFARRAAKSPAKNLPGGRIIAKMNSLQDEQITEKLYEASAAGVKVTLIVRGFCCLRPGVPGLSDNIRVISVVGRFLEHSRIFYFGAGQKDPLDGEWYIGSADWMYRNLNARVEAIVPVRDTRARARLQRVVDVNVRDQRKAWDLLPEGEYTRRTPPPPARPGADEDSPERLGTFETLMRDAAAAGEGR